jgi:hypothetical protein
MRIMSFFFIGRWVLGWWILDGAEKGCMGVREKHGSMAEMMMVIDVLGGNVEMEKDMEGIDAMTEALLSLGPEESRHLGPFLPS